MIFYYLETLRCRNLSDSVYLYLTRFVLYYVFVRRIKANSQVEFQERLKPLHRIAFQDPDWIFLKIFFSFSNVSHSRCRHSRIKANDSRLVVIIRKGATRKAERENEISRDELQVKQLIGKRSTSCAYSQENIGRRQTISLVNSTKKFFARTHDEKLSGKGRAGTMSARPS